MIKVIKDKSLLVPYLSLLTSAGTLFCCALPILLVSLGMGAAFAGFVGAFPQVVWLSENKLLVFVVSGGLILASSTMIYINRDAPCPMDRQKALACTTSRKWSIRILAFSAVIWVTGFGFAFLSPAV